MSSSKPCPANATFLVAASPYFTGLGTFDNTTVAGFLNYHPPDSSSSPATSSSKLVVQPALPAINDTSFVANFTGKFRRLREGNVPQTVGRRFYFTVGLGSNPCPKNQTCQGPNGTKFSSSVNNVSFSRPTVALLQSYYNQKQAGVFTTDFPSFPIIPFNYTGSPPNNTYVSSGTKVVVLKYNTSVELVFQGTSILGAESHPLHLHGYNFFVVGQGFGNYDPANDPTSFNLVDPVERNTLAVPTNGWAAIRFYADNPGVWFMHCHFDVHLSWGLSMAWMVLDGDLPSQKLSPPPFDLPKC